MTQTTVEHDTSNEESVKTFGKPPKPVVDVVDDEGNTYCQLHPQRETGLRCNNCTRLMCAECAVHTPVGYRCQQCVREKEDRFFNADPSYYAILFGASVFGGAAGAFVSSLFGWFILFTFFIAAIAGGMIAEFALRLTKGKRGRYAAPVATAVSWSVRSCLRGSVPSFCSTRAPPQCSSNSSPKLARSVPPN